MVDIRKVNAQDADALALFSEYDDYILEILGENRIYYHRYSPIEALEEVWVAYQGAQPVGCIAYRTKQRGVGEVKRLYVRPDMRRQGVGIHLYRKFEEYAKSQACTALFLDTRLTLEAAVKLYQSIGFVEVFREGLYIQMEKSLQQTE